MLSLRSVILFSIEDPIILPNGNLGIIKGILEKDRFSVYDTKKYEVVNIDSKKLKKLSKEDIEDFVTKSIDDYSLEWVSEALHRIGKDIIPILIPVFTKYLFKHQKMFSRFFPSA